MNETPRPRPPVPVKIGRRHYEVKWHAFSPYPYVERILTDGARKRVWYREALNVVKAAGIEAVK